MIDIADAGEIKAKISIEYNPEGVKQAKEDLASLAEMGGALESSAGQASDGFAALDEQMSKNAASTKNLTSSMGALEKPMSSGETAIVGMTEALSEQQLVAEDTTKSLSNMQEPLKSYNESLQSISETVSGGHFAENMSAFQSALEDPLPFRTINSYLNETGQSWGDFTSSIGAENSAMLEGITKTSTATERALSGMGRSIKETGTAFTESASSTAEFTKQFNGLNESVVSTGKAMNAFGGVGSALYGPEESFMGGLSRTLGGAASDLGGAFGSIMEGLSSVAMPLMAVQMIGMTVQQVSQAIYDAAALAEGPAAHGVGTFTGSVDALGQTFQRAGSQFSEGFGQQIMPTLNAMNDVMSQSSGAGGIGGFLGGTLSTITNIGEVIGGLVSLTVPGQTDFGMQLIRSGGEGLVNQVAPGTFQGPGPAQQAQTYYQQQMEGLSQTVAMSAAQTRVQASLILAQAVDPQYLAAQNQLSASQRAAQYLQQSYDISHPQSQYQLIQEARYQQYARGQETLLASQPGYGAPGMDTITGYWGNMLGGIGNAFNSPMGTLMFGSLNPYGAISNMGDIFGKGGIGGLADWASGLKDFMPIVSLFSGGGPMGSVFGSIGSGISNWWKDVTAGDSTGLTAGGSEPLPFGCFPAGTRVLMSDGREQAIETLQVGAQVFAHDGVDHGVVTTVLALIKPPPRQVYALTFDDGNTLTLTDSHPVASLQGWKSISPEATKRENPDLLVTALQVGDMVVTASGTCELVGIRPGAVVQIYNITVDEPHTFYANNVLVHNKTMSAGGVGTEQVQLAHTFTAEITWEANNLQKQFTGVANWVGQGLANTFQGIASWIGQGLANTFQGVANWIGSGLSNTFQGVANWIGQGLSNTFQGVANWIGEGLQNTFQGVANWIGQNLNNTFKGVADWVGQGLTNTFKGVADWVGQNLEHTFNAVASWTAQNLTPNFTVNPGFTLLAEGTSNWGGGPAVVGESGTEVVESNGQYSLFDQGATLLNLPAGANVYPMKNLASSSVPQFADGTGGSDFFPISFGGGNSTITLHIQMMMPDGRMMAEHIIPNIAPMIRQQFGRRA